MNRIKRWLFLFFTCGSLVACDMESNHTKIENQYGTVRVPFPNHCSIALDEIDSKFIKKIERVNFDLSIDGTGISSFLLVQHSGTPADVLNPISKALEPCRPNVRTSYNSTEMLALDLQKYEDLSHKDTIRFVAKDGVFISFHRDNK